MTRDEALAAIAAGNFDVFVDVAETLQVEFKRDPYRLDVESQKFELAKDVAALANAEGGLIVIGAETRRNNEAAVDVVTEVGLLPAGLVDEQQYTDTIKERVYPSLVQLHVRFCPSRDDSGRGLIVIDVPPQSEDDRYFLVQRPILEEDRTPGWLFGLAVRSIGRVDNRGIEEVHTLISRGHGVGQQLSDVSEGIAELRELVVGRAVRPPETPADRLDGVIDVRFDEIGA